MPHERREQIELLGAKWDLGVAASNDARAEIDRQIADARFRLRCAGPRGRTLEQGAHTRKDLEEAARLDHVVIGTEPEAAKLFFLGRERRHDQHWRLATFVAETLQHRETVHGR